MRRIFGSLATKALAAAALLVVILGAFAALNGIGSAGEPLAVDVFARQYSWSFGYPDNGNVFSGKALHVPAGREVRFEMYSEDVTHSFWVPEWKVKQDIPPATVVTASITPERAGAYQLICAELCGIEHAYMRAKIVVESPEDFDRWAASVRRKVPPHFSELIRVNEKIDSINEG